MVLSLIIRNIYIWFFWYPNVTVHLQRYCDYFEISNPETYLLFMTSYVNSMQRSKSEFTKITYLDHVFSWNPMISDNTIRTDKTRTKWPRSGLQYLSMNFINEYDNIKTIHAMTLINQWIAHRNAGSEPPFLGKDTYHS